MSRLARLTQFDFHQVLARQSGLSLTLFTKRGCSACRHWAELLATFAAHGAEVALFSVDAEEDAALAREFDLFHLPALFLFRDGQYHSAIHCEARLPALQAAISAAAAGPAQEAP